MSQEPEITTMSEKGQVVIPQEIREHLRIKPKTKFIVFGKGNTIIMKRIELPDLKKEWEDIFQAMNKKGIKLTEKEVLEEISAHRKQKK